MLATLRISHFAIIDALEVSFEPGFNAVTGETGAGKSILISALHLLLGGRAQADLVRTGHDECAVEGLFRPLDVMAVDRRLLAAGLPLCEEGQLLLKRTVHREGRSRASVNGGLCTLAQLAQVVRGLVDISSQHEHTSLLDEATHLSLLDLYAGLGPDLAAYRVAWDALKEAHQARERLRSSEEERARRLDYLKFQLDEIERLNPEAGEDERLVAERQRLAGAARLREATREAEALLYSSDASASELAARAAQEVGRAAAIDPALQAVADSLAAAVAQIDDLARDLGRYSRGLEDDPARLDEIDERLDALKKLARKHGGDLAAVLRRQDEMRREAEELSSHDEALRRAEEARAKALEAAQLLAAALSKKRREAAGAFARAVVDRLSTLDMKKTVFEARVSSRAASEDDVEAGAVRLCGDGQDQVELLLSPNAGEEPRGLARIASGGELSRVMLAVKRVLAERDPVETYVFDEVDAGIGGATGEVVGRMIAEVARGRQVVCITHLAQIAAHAQAHYSVQKSVKLGRTHSEVRRLEGPAEREQEIARMLSGHLTDASRAHARELIESAAGAQGSRPRTVHETG